MGSGGVSLDVPLLVEGRQGLPWPRLPTVAPPGGSAAAGKRLQALRSTKGLGHSAGWGLWDPPPGSSPPGFGSPKGWGALPARLVAGGVETRVGLDTRGARGGGCRTVPVCTGGGQRRGKSSPAPPPADKIPPGGCKFGDGDGRKRWGSAGPRFMQPPSVPRRPSSLRVPGLCSCALPCSLIASVITSVSDLRAGWASEKEEKELLGVCTCPYVCIWASESENGTGICHLRPNGRLSGHRGSALQPLARVCRSLVAAAARNQWAQVTPNPPWGCQGQGFPS